MGALEKLRQYWIGAGVTWTQAPEASVQELEARYGVRLPSDFRQYLLEACPASANEMDLDMTTWWDLARIKNVPDEYGHHIANAEVAAESSVYLFFADYMIWAAAWAINCGEGVNRGRVITFADFEAFVADSFDDFLERYPDGPDTLAFPT